MTLRTTKILLVLAVALYYTIVVFSNVTDYGSNYEFLRHVMMMDSTFPGNHGMWRAINAPWAHTAFYLSIIAWEFVTMILCWWGGLPLARLLHASNLEFQRAKTVAIVGLTVSLLMWFVAFLTVGGEWFLMWQSKTWNGRDEAFRMFTVVGIVLLLLVQPEAEASL
jgi:predicted small integral membrane protein